MYQYISIISSRAISDHSSSSPFIQSQTTVLEIIFHYSQEIQYVPSNLSFGWTFYKLDLT